MWERLGESFVVLVVGMGGVIGCLLFFYLVIGLINKVDAWAVERQKERAERLRNMAASSRANKAAPDGDEELLAVITAAAESMLSKQIVVKNLRFLSDSNPTSWATIGRMNLISSHNIQKQWERSGQ